MKKFLFVWVLILVLFTAGCSTAAPAAVQETGAAPSVAETATPDTAPPASASKAPPVETPSPAEGGVKTSADPGAAMKTVLDFVAARDDAPYGAAVCQQMAFNGGTLVLCEALSDGEIYPELYFVDKDNALAAYTIGSDCWSLNFTEMDGKRIYYGIVNGQQPAAEVAVRYEDGKDASAEPYAGGAIELRNATKDSEDFVKGLQGYIIVADRKDMPYSIDWKLKDGTSLSTVEEMAASEDRVPEYMDKADKSFRNACYFRYNRMLTVDESEALADYGLMELTYGDMSNPLDYAGLMPEVSAEKLAKSLGVYAICGGKRVAEERLTSGGKIAFELADPLPEEASISCYFSPLTADTWKAYKETGSIGAMQGPVKMEHDKFKLPKAKGYYLVAVCVKDTDMTAGTLVYTGVIALKG